MMHSSTPPNGWQFFKKYAAVALRDFREEKIKKGDTFEIEMVPSQQVYGLNAEGLVFRTDLVEGKDFRRVP